MRSLSRAFRTFAALVSLAAAPALVLSTSPASASDNSVLRHIAGGHAKGGNGGWKQAGHSGNVHTRPGYGHGAHGHKKPLARHTGEMRSGVRYVSGGDAATVRYHRGHHIRGGHYKGRLVKRHHSDYTKRVTARGPSIARRKLGGSDTVVSDGGGFSNSGLIVLSINNHSFNNHGGMSEVAGGSAGDDCAYGTYCTIDLGGPKIITFNDVADFSGGKLATEEPADPALHK